MCLTDSLRTAAKAYEDGVFRFHCHYEEDLKSIEVGSLDLPLRSAGGSLDCVDDLLGSNLLAHRQRQLVAVQIEHALPKEAERQSSRLLVDLNSDQLAPSVARLRESRRQLFNWLFNSQSTQSGLNAMRTDWANRSGRVAFPFPTGIFIGAPLFALAKRIARADITAVSVSAHPDELKLARALSSLHGPPPIYEAFNLMWPVFPPIGKNYSDNEATDLEEEFRSDTRALRDQLVNFLEDLQASYLKSTGRIAATHQINASSAAPHPGPVAQPAAAPLPRKSILVIEKDGKTTFEFEGISFSGHDHVTIFRGLSAIYALVGDRHGAPISNADFAKHVTGEPKKSPSKYVGNFIRALNFHDPLKRSDLFRIKKTKGSRSFSCPNLSFQKKT